MAELAEPASELSDCWKNEMDRFSMFYSPFSEKYFIYRVAHEKIQYLI
jgi:hypothetical protein